MSDIYQFNVGGTTYNLANLGLLAPVQITLTADRLYNTGDQFIYTGLLYEATETIAQGTSITIGSNAQLADCVTKQISEINSNLSARVPIKVASFSGNTGTYAVIDFSQYTGANGHVVSICCDTAYVFAIPYMQKSGKMLYMGSVVAYAENMDVTGKVYYTEN